MKAAGYWRNPFSLRVLCACVVLSAAYALPGWALADTLEGPRSVTETLKNDEGIANPHYRPSLLTDALQPWYDFKTQLNSEHQFALGWDYSIGGQYTTSDLGDDTAIGHDLRFYGTWTPVNPGGPNTGSLTIKFEWREAYTRTSPNGLGFNSGAAAITAGNFSDAGWVLTNLYWKQRLFDDRLTIGFGQIDVTDYLDFYALANALTAFQNSAFSGSPAIAAPGQGLGFGAGLWLSDHVYVSGGMADANGDPNDPIGSIDRFFNTGESFQDIEIGYASSRKRAYLDNIHASFWHVDARNKAGVPEGYGASVSAAWAIDDKFLPFLRAGYAHRGGALYNRSVSIGLAYLTPWRDLFGMGLNWARPQGLPPTAKSGAQFILETFYRYQVSRELAITFDAQLIGNPVLNQSDDTIAYLGLRTRLAL